MVALRATAAIHLARAVARRGRSRRGSWQGLNRRRHDDRRRTRLARRLHWHRRHELALRRRDIHQRRCRVQQRRAAAHDIAVVDHGAGHRLAVNHHLARHRGHGAGRADVAVRDGRGRQRLRWPPRAIHRLVRPVVDAILVARRGAVVGLEDLTRRQRHPRHRRAADVDGDARARAAYPGHQRRCVDRPRHVLARAPAPAAPPVHPAAVVEGREAPARVVHPGPAPGLDPGPTAVAVGRPVGAHRQRHPDGAVVGVLLPAAIAIEFFGACHFRRHVARRCAAFLAPVFADDPGREGVVGRAAEARAQHAGAFAPQLHALAGFNREAIALIDPQRAAQCRRVGGVVDAVQPVQARSQRSQHGLGGDEVDFDGHFARPHVQGQAAAMQLQHDALVVDAHQLDFAGLGQAQDGRAHAQFGGGGGAGAQAITTGQRPVALGLGPLALFVVVPGHGALCRGQAGDAPRRVVLRQGRGGQPGGGHESQRSQPGPAARHQ